MRVIIAGSRDFNNYQFLQDKCLEIFLSLRDELGLDTSKESVTIVSGGAKGVDTMGEQFAKQFGLGLEIMLADWHDLSVEGAVVKSNQYGEYNAVAGHQRNERMAKFASEDTGILIAFWKNGSTGTKNMIDLAKKYELVSFVVEVD